MVCEEKPPQGCAVATVSDKCEVHVLLKVQHVTRPFGDVTRDDSQRLFLVQLSVDF